MESKQQTQLSDAEIDSFFEGKASEILKYIEDSDYIEESDYASVMYKQLVAANDQRLYLILKQIGDDIENLKKEFFKYKIEHLCISGNGLVPIAYDLCAVRESVSPRICLNFIEFCMSRFPCYEKINMFEITKLLLSINKIDSISPFISTVLSVSDVERKMILDKCTNFLDVNKLLTSCYLMNKQTELIENRAIELANEYVDKMHGNPLVLNQLHPNANRLFFHLNRCLDNYNADFHHQIEQINTSAWIQSDRCVIV